MDRKLYNPTYLQCPTCLNVNTIQRKKRSPRDEGHIKDLWCHVCKDVTKHVEHKREWMFESRVLNIQNEIKQEVRECRKMSQNPSNL